MPTTMQTWPAVPRTRRRAATGVRGATIAAVVAVLVVVAPPAADDASASTTCDRWASSTGDDGNDGSRPERAVGTLGHLAAMLGPGETGCIPAGDTFVAHGAGVIGGVQATPDRPITITSGPGGRAAIVGGILFSARSHDVVFRDLDVVGDGFTGNAIHVEGRSIRLSGIDVRHPTGICIGIGRIDAYRHAYAGVEATDVVVERSRIHGCGTDPSLAPRWADDRYSGAHGVYVVNARRTRIVDNAIHDNKYRGVQVFPYGRDTTIERNVFDGNATHVNVGSTQPDGFPWRSSGTVIRGNVMSNRVTDFRRDKNPGQVHGYLPAGSPADGNVVVGNCLVDEPGAEVTGHGIQVGSNTLAVAVYVGRAAGDFRQTDASPCRGAGPSWARPSSPATSRPAVRCDGATARFVLPTVVTTASGTPTWAFSRIWYRADGGTWQHRTWFAAWANAAVAPEPWWSLPPGASGWARIAADVDLGLPPARIEAWEQRYELVDGVWQHEWHHAGRCP